MNKQRMHADHHVKISSKLFSGLLLMALFYLLMQAILSGITYITQYHVNTTLDQWFENQEPASLVEWEGLESFALASMQRNENHTTTMHAMGRVYDYRSSKMAKSRKEQFFYGEKSIVYYRQVTQHRPAWPYGWMNLALAKAHLGLLDEEFERALMQLLKTGPWEKTTLPLIIQLALFSWDSLHEMNQQRLLDYFLIAQEKREGEVHKTAQFFGEFALYCKLVTQRGAKARFCW